MSDSVHEPMTSGPTDQDATSGGPQTPDEIRLEIERTREELGETVEALAAKTDVKARAQDHVTAAKESIAAARDNAAHTISAARGGAQDKADGFIARAREVTPESAATGAQQIGSTVHDRPLPFAAAGAFVAGLTIGWLLGRR
jgi:ElaB/YqjD/DUF883 family membrane-anchored ribosome-binding protein